MTARRTTATARGPIPIPFPIPSSGSGKTGIGIGTGIGNGRPVGDAAAMSSDTTPPAGLRMPAEWEPHEATWLAWPHHADDWPGKFDAIPWVYADIVHHLHQCENVHILTDAADEARARECLRRRGVDLGRVRFFPFATDRVWTRDYCP